MVGRPRVAVAGGWYCVGDIERPRSEASEFVRRVCELAGHDPDQLGSRARDRNTADARKVVATLGVERWSQRRAALAAVLNKNPDVVSFGVGEGAPRRQEEPEWAARLDELDERLSAALTQPERDDDATF